MLKKTYRLLLIISSKVMSLVCHSRLSGIFHSFKPEGLQADPRQGEDKSRNDRNRHGDVVLLMNLLVIILISIIFPASAYSGSDWKITLKVSGSGIYDYCIAGVKDGATDGHDNAWDIPAPPGSLNKTYINAYFPHPEWNYVFERFRQDIRSPDLPKEWTFEVVSNISGYLTIQWPDLKNAIPDKEAVLVDIDGSAEEIDMHTCSSFTFFYENNGYPSPRKFAVKISQSISVPEPPEGLKGNLIKEKSVLLQWKSNKELDLDGYNVYRSTTSGSGGYQRVNYSLISEHQYVDEQIVKGETYYYVVTAVNTLGGESGYSNEVEVIVGKSKVGKGKK